ncbi:MAG: hypothetical protein M3373_05685 [Gemmatimonadota bacterium]|nr:hypothetical protein [Gemmatimonadota bacterium]
MAQERWTLGIVAWSPQRLEARAVDNNTGAPVVFASFEATASPDAATSLEKVGGDQQSGTLGSPLADSLAVRATDSTETARAALR